MSPARRKAQVHISGKRDFLPSLVAPAGEPTARPLVRFNLHFFPRDRDRTRIHALVVLFHGFREKRPAMSPAKRRELQAQINWKALYSLLD